MYFQNTFDATPITNILDAISNANASVDDYVAYQFRQAMLSNMDLIIGIVLLIGIVVFLSVYAATHY